MQTACVYKCFGAAPGTSGQSEGRQVREQEEQGWPGLRKSLRDPPYF